MFKWNDQSDYSTNVSNYIDSVGASRIAKLYLSGKNIRFEDAGNYRANLGTATLIEHLFLDRFEELGITVSTRIVRKALDAEIMDSHFIPKTFNRKVRHGEINHDLPYLLQLMLPYVPTNHLMSGNFRELVRIERSFSLPYFKVINDRITYKMAEDIYGMFTPKGDGYLTMETQNLLVDTNKYIKELIIEYGEESEYPHSDVREMFLF